MRRHFITSQCFAYFQRNGELKELAGSPVCRFPWGWHLSAYPSAYHLVSHSLRNSNIRLLVLTRQNQRSSHALRAGWYIPCCKGRVRPLLYVFLPCCSLHRLSPSCAKPPGCQFRRGGEHLYLQFFLLKNSVS